ncbi:replication protein P [Burkholderia cepacia]|uniref:replication protein P n=1 Tax=Burkholderia cepacia TaxID=292 RepID=UPI0012D8774E|nr:replication protein P [Burkholderia cepacia]
MDALTTSSTLKPSVWFELHPKLGISLMDHLFNRLDGAYPNRWRSSFQTEQAIANWREAWAEAFDEEGVTPELIATGLRACRRKFDWPPSLTEFLSLCKPPINVDVAVYEAIEQMRARQHGKDVWSNPAIYWAAVKVGEYDMLSQTFSQIKPRFERALNAVLEGNVLPVPERTPALPAPGKTYSSQEYGRQRLAELNASGILRSAPAGRNIGWAQKIIAEEERTGKVQANRLRIAREAIAAVGAA